MSAGAEDKASGKTTAIIVNAREHDVEGKEVSYEDVVNLAFNDSPPAGEFIVITVTFSKGDDRKEGSLQQGERVKIKDGMVFNVTATDKS